MFFNFEIAYKCSVYGNNSKSYIKFFSISMYVHILIVLYNCLDFVESNLASLSLAHAVFERPLEDA